MVSVGTVNIKSVNCAHIPKLHTLGGIRSHADAFGGLRTAFKRKYYLLLLGIRMS